MFCVDTPLSVLSTDTGVETRFFVYCIAKLTYYLINNNYCNTVAQNYAPKKTIYFLLTTGQTSGIMSLEGKGRMNHCKPLRGHIGRSSVCTEKQKRKKKQNCGTKEKTQQDVGTTRWAAPVPDPFDAGGRCVLCLICAYARDACIRGQLLRAAEHLPREGRR